MLLLCTASCQSYCSFLHFRKVNNSISEQRYCVYAEKVRVLQYVFQIFGFCREFCDCLVFLY